MTSHAVATPTPRRFTFDNRFLAPVLITLVLVVGQLSFGFLESWTRTALAIGTSILGSLFSSKLASNLASNLHANPKTAHLGTGALAKLSKVSGNPASLKKLPSAMWRSAGGGTNAGAAAVV